MKKKNIFQNQSQEILKLFEDAKNRTKVMCIPIDYAKKEHVVMFCNGNGKIVRKPFSVTNSLKGKQFLTEQVTKSCHHHGIKIKHAFFGGEDCGSYADNFITSLRSEGWLVAGVNACDAKKQRENMQASTDRIDLLGICKMLLNCRGNCSIILIIHGLMKNDLNPHLYAFYLVETRITTFWAPCLSFCKNGVSNLMSLISNPPIRIS